MSSKVQNGFWKLETYTNGYQIVVLGSPPSDQGEDDPLCHNCDEMGCSSVEHVIARIPIMYPLPELSWAKSDYTESPPLAP